MDIFKFSATPLRQVERLSEWLGVDVKVKQDDGFPIPGGGNKARKAQFIFRKALEYDYNAIVTTGSAQSNHVYASAVMAAQAGWKAIFVIHDQEPKTYGGHLKLVKLTGADIVFTTLANVKETMDQAINKLKSQGYKPFYIYGGGHSLEGSISHYYAVQELYDQLPSKKIDRIFVASGTGGTQAGLLVGAKHLFPMCKVIGISVARNQERGVKPIYTSALELATHLRLKVSVHYEDILFDDTFIGAGYGAVYPELLETIKTTATSYGVLLDPTYTGKAFHGMLDYIQTGKVDKDSIVIFWHTGGLINLLTSSYI